MVTPSPIFSREGTHPHCFTEVQMKRKLIISFACLMEHLSVYCLYFYFTTVSVADKITNLLLIFDIYEAHNNVMFCAFTVLKAQNMQKCKQDFVLCHSVRGVPHFFYTPLVEGASKLGNIGWETKKTHCRLETAGMKDRRPVDYRLTALRSSSDYTQYAYLHRR